MHSGVASYGVLGHVPLSTSNSVIFNSLWSKSDRQLSKSVVCKISWCRYQQLTALSISTALVAKLLVIEQLLHPALKFAVSAPWPTFQLCPSSQQILATPLKMPKAYTRLLPVANIKLVGRLSCQLPATPQRPSGHDSSKTSVSSHRVVFEKTLADVDLRSTNGVGGIPHPTADCHVWSACCVFCWLFASFSIFSFIVNYIWFMLSKTLELHEECKLYSIIVNRILWIQFFLFIINFT